MKFLIGYTHQLYRTQPAQVGRKVVELPSKPTEEDLERIAIEIRRSWNAEISPRIEIIAVSELAD